MPHNLIEGVPNQGGRIRLFAIAQVPKQHRVLILLHPFEVFFEYHL